MPVDSSGAPGAAVALNLHFLDFCRPAPGRARDPVAPAVSGAPAGHARDHRLQIVSRDGSIEPDRSLRRLDRPEALIISRHVTAFITARDNLDARQPLDLRHPVPA